VQGEKHDCAHGNAVRAFVNRPDCCRASVTSRTAKRVRTCNTCTTNKRDSRPASERRPAAGTYDGKEITHEKKINTRRRGGKIVRKNSPNGRVTCSTRVRITYRVS